MRWSAVPVAETQLKVHRAMCCNRTAHQPRLAWPAGEVAAGLFPPNGWVAAERRPQTQWYRKCLVTGNALSRSVLGGFGWVTQKALWWVTGSQEFATASRVVWMTQAPVKGKWPGSVTNAISVIFLIFETEAKEKRNLTGKT